mgnify:CR=1 FL=1
MFNRRKSKELCEAARAYHEFRAARNDADQAFYDSVLNDMHTLDEKSTGLITFISLVLAAITFALGLVDRTMEYAFFIRGGLIFFISVFALAAWFSLRCLEMTGPPFTITSQDPDIHAEAAIEEVAARRYNYFISLRLTRAAFTMLVPFVLVWIGLLAREIY